MTEIAVLGPLVADADGTRVDLGGLKQRTVIAALTIARGRVVPLYALIDDLWGDNPPLAATSTLHGYLSHLRKALEPGRAAKDRRLLVTEPPGYALRLTSDQLDASRYEAMLREVDATIATDPAAARRLLERADELWRGPAYAEFTHIPTAMAEANRLDELRHSAHERHAELLLAEGDLSAAIAALDVLVTRVPRRERPRELLMLAQHRDGRQADALRTYADAHSFFVEELGLTPGRALREMERRILEQDPTLDAPRGAPVTLTVPQEQAMADAKAPAEPERPGPDDLVGRSEELAQLRSSAAVALVGQTRFALIGGEPGIGKTRLAEELCRELGAQGWRVAWGRCHDDEGAPALWPIDAILDDLGRRSIANLVESTAGDGAWALYAAIADELHRATESVPTCLAIEDLHWADQATSRFLAFLATEVRTANLLVVATFRTTELLGADVAVASLARTPGAIRLELDGFDDADITAFIRSTSGTDVPPAVAEVIRARTGGNPFFVGELTRLLASERRLDHRAMSSDEIPAAVRDVVTSRLDKLPNDTQIVLGVAAVAGRTFRVDDVGAVCALSAEELDDALDAAIVTRLVEPIGPDATQLRFGHAIVQETVYADVTPLRRARLHGRLLEAISSRPDRAHRAAELAHHAARAGDLDAVVTWSAAAAEQAELVNAYHEAALHWDAARAAARQIDAPLEVQLAAAVGTVRTLRLSGDMRGSGDALADAAALADASGDPAALAVVASAFGGFSLWQWRPYGEYDSNYLALLRRAVAQARPDDFSTRALLLSALAVEGYYEPGSADHNVDVTSAAVSAARQTGDPTTLGAALNALIIGGWFPGSAERQLAAAEELAGLSGPHLAPEVELVGRLHRNVYRLTVGDATNLAAEVASCVAHADDLHQPILRVQAMWQQAMFAGMAGDHERAMKIAGAAHPLHAALGFSDADIQVALIEFEHRWHVGGLAELRPLLEHGPAIEMYRSIRAMVALCALDAGDDDAARLLDEAGQAPHDWLGMFHAVLAAEVAARLLHPLGDSITEWLAPYADSVVVVGSGSICLGSVHHFLGSLAVARGDPARARAHLEESERVNRRIGAVRWAERSRRQRLVLDE